MTDEPRPVPYVTLIGQHARTRAAAPALTFEGRTLTWAELHARTNRIAHAMAARGVREGDLVTIALPNGFGFVETVWATWKLGATPQPVSFRLPRAELDAVVELANPRLLIAPAGMESARAHVDAETLLGESADESDLPEIISPSWKAMTSGGSTGHPKLIVAAAPAVRAPVVLKLFDSEPDDVLIVPGPMYHNGPFISLFGGHFVGAHVILTPRFDPEETLALIAKHRATWLYVVPTMMSRIWRLPDDVKAKHDVSSLRVVWHVAAPCPAWLKEAWIGWLGADTIMEVYGGTEGQAATVISGSEWLTHRGSVGRLAFGEAKAFDADGKPLPPGEVGEIYLHHPEMVERSYTYVGATARTLPGGWESLGDIGYLDEEGYLYLADRSTVMILVGGSNVYPAEIEAALDAHPMVQSSCAIGLPHEDMGNSVHAIVQARAGVSEDDLRAHMAKSLVTYKQPRSYEFVSFALRDDAGKVRRTQLRDERIAARKE
jgi:bile acid-coenzyme A ligase